MALTTEEYERVINFLDANMTLAEMEAFEKELVTNPEMRAQLDFEQSIRDVFAQQSKDENGAPVIKTKKLWVYYTALAACTLGIISLATWYQSKRLPATDTVVRHDSLTIKKDSIPLANDKNHATNDSLFAALFKQYYTKDKAPENPPMFLAEALGNYEDGQYAKLQSLDISQAPETRGAEDSINSKENIQQLGHYYKGISYLETDETKPALENLEWVMSNSNNFELREKARWYLALGYLKNKQEDKAKFGLIALSKKASDRQLKKQAKELLAILKR